MSDEADKIYQAGYDEGLMAIRRAADGDQWVAVSERLPEPNQSVALLDVNRRENCDFERNIHACGYLATWGGLPGFWSVHGQRAITLESFTHWMPLPPSPAASGLDADARCSEQGE